MTPRPIRTSHPPTLPLAAIAAAAIALLGLPALAEPAGGRVHDGLSPTVVRAAQTVSSGGWPVTECGTYSGKGCSPTSDRVDLERPTFSKPTEITNPLFPISRLRSVVLLGKVDGKPFRSETTLLPGTGTVRWDGQKIKVLVSQYVAYLDGRVEEIALDRYAQADDGAVWYLGEDVFDYRRGSVAITEGTWLAGRDGPPAMIMPAQPKVGDVFRAENVIGVVFEEVRVKAVDQSVDGPRGPVTGAIIGEELHLDGSTSDKVFAPSYGEFLSRSDGEVEALALAVPTDALDGPPSPELTRLTTSSWGILENARLGDWQAASATVRRMNAAWKVLQTRKPPPLVAARIKGSLAGLTRAVKARQSARVSQQAVDVAQSALDLQLRHLPAVEVDVERVHLHTQQLRVHAKAKDLAGVAGEVAVLEWLRDRITDSLRPPDLQEIDARLRELRAATDARNLPAAADHAARLAARVRQFAAR